jgi:hypothetical protein
VTATALSRDQAFVAQVYRDLLHREANPGEIAVWVAPMEDPNPLTRYSRAAVAQGIQASSEHRALVVQDLYHRLLRRAASDFADSDPANNLDGHSLKSEVGMWLNQLATAKGFTETMLEADILGSPEYFGQRGGLNNGGWLIAVYQDVLGRTVDVGGSLAWNKALQSTAFGSTPDDRRVAVAQAILTAPSPFGMEQEAETDEVAALYQQFLRRPANVAGGETNPWVDSLQAGATLESVRAAIIGSDEYFARL